MSPVLRCIMVAAFFGMTFGCGRDSNVQLEKHIKDLGSSDFRTVREAQSAITAMGKGVVPRLSREMRSSVNGQQIALCCYLIGTIDPEAYYKTLSEFAIPGRLCVILRYPNTEAIAALNIEQKRELETRLKKMTSIVQAEEAACIDKLLKDNPAAWK